MDMARRMEIVRLGEGVDRTRMLSAAAIERTRLALDGYAREIAACGATRVRMVATSALRDARNADEFQHMVRATLGVSPEVITGAQEARLSLTGAILGLPADVPGPCLVIDIGGGSTEFVVGARRQAAAGLSGSEVELLGAISVDIGCVRMTERHALADPPTADQIAAVRAEVGAAVDRALAAVPVGAARTLVGLAGSVTTVAGIALNLDRYDRERIHRARIGYPHVAKVTAGLLAADREERSRIPVLHPGRIDVIGAGALILQTIMERTGFDEIVVSEHDILDGIAWSIA